jgi:hypothetical protein
MADVWACRQCRSINQPRHNRCYACQTPRAIAGVDPLKLSITDRSSAVTGPIGTYRSTAGLALLTTLLVAAALAASVVGTLVNLGIVKENLNTPASSSTMTTTILILLSAVMLAIAAWAAWLSRAVANLPTLGLGYGRTSPRFVFIESLIPIYNVWRVQRIVMDILRRIHPSPRDQTAVLIAWLPLLASIAIPAIMVRVVHAVSLKDTFATLELGSEIAVGLQIVAGLFLIALIWRVEGRMRLRRRELGA